MQSINAYDININLPHLIDNRLLLELFEDGAIDIGKGRRDFGVEGPDFATAMNGFKSKTAYMKVCVKFEEFSFGLASDLPFAKCCLAFINHMHDSKNIDGSNQYKVGACRTAFSMLKKLGQFCHGISSFRTACPQIDVLLNQWEKLESEPHKALALTESEVERIFHLILTAENIHMIVSS